MKGIDFSRFCAKHFSEESFQDITISSWVAAQSFSTVSKPCASIQSSAMNFDM